MSEDKKAEDRKQAAQATGGEGIPVDSHPDAALFTAMAAMVAGETFLRYAPPSDEEVAMYDDERIRPHLETIIETEAKTVLGLRVKFMVLANWAEFDMEPPQSILARLAKAIEHDLGTMTDKAPSKGGTA